MGLVHVLFTVGNRVLGQVKGILVCVCVCVLYDRTPKGCERVPCSPVVQSRHSASNTRKIMTLTVRRNYRI